MKKKLELEAPLSANERFLYAVAVRLDVLIEQVSSIIEHISKEDEVAVTESNIEAVKEIEPEIKEEVKLAPVKRTRTRTKK
jgi:hypothetical protein